jgi:hypothetical protein
MVESIMAYSLSASAAQCSNMLSHTPVFDHLLKREFDEEKVAKIKAQT